MKRLEEIARANPRLRLSDVFRASNPAELEILKILWDRGGSSSVRDVMTATLRAR